jgi:hypothetical protein
MNYYTLRKSVGPWSSGTVVDMIRDATELVYPKGTVNPGYSTIRLPNGKVIDIEFDLVVKRRIRAMEVPAVNAKERRRRRKALNKLTQLGQTMEGGYR